MDFSSNGYEFFFEIDTMRLLYGKYTHVAQITRVLDDVNRREVPLTQVTCKTNEIYGTSEQDAWDQAAKIAREWAEAQPRY